VADGQGGRLVPVGDSHALAHAVLELLADPAAAQRLAETGRQQVLTRYSLDAMVEQTIAVYRSVLPKRR